MFNITIFNVTTKKTHHIALSSFCLYRNYPIGKEKYEDKSKAYW